MIGAVSPSASAGLSPPRPAGRLSEVVVRAAAPCALVVTFGGLLAWHASVPAGLVFDEIHYVPAARALAHLADDLNWEHPPLSKWILGLCGRVLSEWLRVVPEPAAYRLVTGAFGLWALLSVSAVMRDLGYRPAIANAAAWLTGLDFLWFVQSRTAMPDVFAVAFALAGVRRARRNAGGDLWIAAVELGLAMACKWSAAPLCVVAALFARPPLRRLALFVLVAVLAYVVPFLPLALLREHATPWSGIPAYQLRMLDGFGRVDLAQHPYASRFWQWPTLLRPAWYHFEQTPAGDRYVWAGGNPLLFALALTASVWAAIEALRPRGDPRARALALLYFAPLAFWAALRRPGLFYYFLPSSMWLGALVAWAVVRLAGPNRRAAGVALVLLVAACAAVFLWFIPILDGRLSAAGSYERYMWLRSWR